MVCFEGRGRNGNLVFSSRRKWKSGSITKEQMFLCLKSIFYLKKHRSEGKIVLGEDFTCGRNTQTSVERNCMTNCEKTPLVV